MSEENAEVTVETTETVEELQERLRKAEAKIVDMKKSTTPAKEAPKEDAPVASFDEDVFEKKYEEKKFFESNPDMLEYKEKLESYTSKGINWNEAKVLVEQSDPTIAERQKTNSMNMTGDIITSGKSAYTMEELKKIAGTDQRAYNSLMEQVDKGEVTIT